MESISWLISYLLSSMGLTVLIVWPETGPSTWLREHMVRVLLPIRARKVLDCYICCNFRAALVLFPVWWYMSRQLWCCAGCLMVPAVFWILLERPK